MTYITSQTMSEWMKSQGFKPIDTNGYHMPLPDGGYIYLSGGQPELIRKLCDDAYAKGYITGFNEAGGSNG